MANSSKISRRNFMQQSALWAAAFAGVGTIAPRNALAAREKRRRLVDLSVQGFVEAAAGPQFRPGG